MKVLHLHETHEIRGGSEVYIDLLQSYLPLNNVSTFWLGIIKVPGGYQLNSSLFSHSEFVSRNNVYKYLVEKFVHDGYSLIHIHGISDPFLVKICLSLLPVVRSLHEPRVFCPGAQKFFLKSEQICTVPFGVHCVLHAYSQACCNRHPTRLMRSYYNTYHELHTATKKYKAVIVMSNYMKDEAIAAGVNPEKIIVNPYFVEEVPFTPRIPNGDNTILYIGRLHASKGVHYLLKAFSLMDARVLETSKLIIIGGGSFEHQLKQQALQLNIHSKVEFKGWLSREAINTELANADVVAVPSIYPEAFGIVGIEAMMAGKPVVGFNVGGIPDWLRNFETGFGVPVKDVESFAKAMSTLLTDPALYNQFSTNSRQVALAEYLPEDHLRELISIYQRAVN